jgi:hypothetical protein
MWTVTLHDAKPLAIEGSTANRCGKLMVELSLTMTISV